MLAVSLGKPQMSIFPKVLPLVMSLARTTSVDLLGRLLQLIKRPRITPMCMVLTQLILQLPLQSKIHMPLVQLARLVASLVDSQAAFIMAP